MKRFLSKRERETFVIKKYRINTYYDDYPQNKNENFIYYFFNGLFFFFCRGDKCVNVLAIITYVFRRSGFSDQNCFEKFEKCVIKVS